MVHYMLSFIHQLKYIKIFIGAGMCNFQMLTEISQYINQIHRAVEPTCIPHALRPIDISCWRWTLYVLCCLDSILLVRLFIRNCMINGKVPHNTAHALSTHLNATSIARD